jgi:hypothetical protein
VFHTASSLSHDEPPQLRPILKGVGKTVMGTVGYAAFFSVASRRWHRCWGTAGEETAVSLPGDGLVCGVALQTTRGIDIHARPAKVWPWLVQIGQGRGGFYTYKWIENLLGARIRNLDRIEPHLQQLSVGNEIRLTPEAYLGHIPGQCCRVMEIRPERALVTLQELPSGGLSSWSFNLRPVGADVTRLLVRGRSSAPSALPRGSRERSSCYSLSPAISSWNAGCCADSRRAPSAPRGHRRRWLRWP